MTIPLSNHGFKVVQDFVHPQHVNICSDAEWCDGRLCIGRGIIFEHRFWIIFEHRCPGSFSNTEWVIFEHMGYPAAPVGWGGVGWGSCVRLLLRDRATASWGWGWGRGGAVTFASYCVTVRLRPRAGGRGQPGGSESQVTLDFLKLRCPRRLALVGPRKVVKTRPNGRNTSRGKLKGRYYSVKKP